MRKRRRAALAAALQKLAPFPVHGPDPRPILDVEAFHEPHCCNADFPVGASRRLENRRYEAERVHSSDACPTLEFETPSEPGPVPTAVELMRLYQVSTNVKGKE